MPVPQQVAQQLQTMTIPAPTRGLILNENESFMQPGGALVLDNWKPTMKGTGAARRLHQRWATLPETHAGRLRCSSTSAATISSMFAGNATKLYDVTTPTPTLVKSGQTVRQLLRLAARQPGRRLPDSSVNDAGDFPLRFDGTTWTDAATPARSPAPVGVDRRSHGHNLTYVWKYRNRCFFIEGSIDERVVSAAQRHRRRAVDDPAVGRRHQGRQAVVRARPGRSTPATASTTSACSAPTRASC